MFKALYYHYTNLHTIPEIGYHLPKTKAYIMHCLKHMNCMIFNPINSSIVAYFDFKQKDTIAFKCDMDALDLNNIPIHACGHDGHMAILLSLAHYINNMHDLNHNVLLIFESGEEKQGDSEEIIRSQCFDKVKPKYIYGMHIWPNLIDGIIYTSPSTLLAGSKEITLTASTIQVHPMNYQKSKDLLFITTCLLSKLYEINIPNTLLCLNNINKMSTINVNGGNIEINGTIRYFNDDAYNELIKAIKKEIEVIFNTYNLSFNLSLTKGYYPIKNNEYLINKIKANSSLELINDKYYASDDFSIYQQYTSGVYFLLGSSSKASLHSNDFTFNLDILSHGLAFYINLLTNNNIN